MLGFRPLPRNLSAALRDLGHENAEVRRAALRDLSKLGRASEREPALLELARILREDKSPEVRAEAALALADLGGREHVSALLAATHDAQTRVRQMALVALGELGEHADSELVELIAHMSADAAPAIRFQAVVALHHLNSSRILDILVHATRDSDPEVRHIAFRIAEERFAPGSAGAGAACEPPAMLLLRARAALRDDRFAVRLSAAILLSRWKDSSGAPVIVEAVNRPRATPFPEDEQAAVELAGELGLDAARPGLRRRSFGLLGFSRGPFSWHARVALARLGDDRAKSTILRDLGAWSRDARTIAVAAAGQARMAEALPIIAQMVDRPERADPEAVAEALTELKTT